MVALAGAVAEMAAETRAAAAAAAVEREAETRVEGSVSGARAMAATVAVGKEAGAGVGELATVAEGTKVPPLILHLTGEPVHRSLPQPFETSFLSSPPRRPGQRPTRATRQ